ncbi:MAG: hypothetical protein HPY74_19910 [Firmicutes bacterium]|nr:hypothetical protein [Bacillota bacterium]
MVQINNNYYIKFEDKNFTLLKQIGLRKNGRPKYKIIGYFGSLEPLFNALFKMLVLDAVPSN